MRESLFDQQPAGAEQSAPARTLTAAVLTCGDELVGGFTVDTNSAWLSLRLAGLGFKVIEHRSVGDALEDNVRAARDLASRVTLVLMSGGLGPTEDDRTRQALADAAGVPLEENPDARAGVEARLALVGRPMGPENTTQCFIPRGGTVVPNRHGTAPGFAVRIGQALFVAIPGVPSEVFAMWDETVVPHLRGAFPSLPPAGVVREVKVAGPSEAKAGQAIADLMRPAPGRLVGITTHGVPKTIRIQAPDKAAADALVKDVAARLGDAVFSTTGESLAAAVVRRIKALGESIAVAESCTGGGLCAALASVPGVSEVFRGGVVAYDNAVKEQMADVPAALLRKHGAVSEPVARALAEGAARRFGTDIGIGITGIAGPGGAVRGKPVGTVHVAICRHERTSHLLLHTNGDRAMVQSRTVDLTLDALRRALDIPLDPARNGSALMKTLGKAYPNAAWFSDADMRDPFRLLVGAVLSQRTLDRNTDIAMEKLFAKAATPAAIVALKPPALLELIRSVSFHNQKAEALREISRILIERHDGKVPPTRTALMELPKVGRKTANVVLAVGFGVPAIPVDGHIDRVPRRLGLVPADCEDVELELMQIVPRAQWLALSERLVALGQNACVGVSPKCSECPLTKSCPRIGVGKSR